MSLRHLGRAVLPASGQGSSWCHSPSSGATVLALAPAPSLPLSGLSFPIWRSHESSVLGGPIHVSLVWVIGQAMGGTLPLAASCLCLHSLSWEHLSLALRMSFPPGSMPSLDQSDLLAFCLVLAGSRVRTLQVWTKGLKHPLTPDRHSEGRT